MLVRHGRDGRPHQSLFQPIPSHRPSLRRASSRRTVTRQIVAQILRITHASRGPDGMSNQGSRSPTRSPPSQMSGTLA